MLVCWWIFSTSNYFLIFVPTPALPSLSKLQPILGNLYLVNTLLFPSKNSILKLSIFSSPHLPPFALWSAISSKLRMSICPLGIHYKNSNRYARFRYTHLSRLQNLWIGLDVLLFNTLFRPFQLRQTPALPAPIYRQQKMSTSSTFFTENDSAAKIMWH